MENNFEPSLIGGNEDEKPASPERRLEVIRNIVDKIREVHDHFVEEARSKGLDGGKDFSEIIQKLEEILAETEKILAEAESEKL